MTLTTKRRAAAALAVLTTVVAPIGGCSAMSPSQPEQPDTPTLSDDESRGQVVDAAKEIVRAADLDVTYANLQWEWCNDQGNPPYRAKVELAFVTASGENRSAEIATSVAAQPGWESGPPPGYVPAGEVVHRGGVWASIGPGNNPERGGIQIYGECRNMNDHRDTPGVEITDEIRGG
ncbi:hypothetical protein [Mycolicibacterium gilvum]|uniref:hypothetical protein n=1 Tax=Mycolicibacterium gilvum TaxID=1804 RepID=UPI0040462528